MQAVSLYKRRLEWLTTESRRIFGVIQEKCVAVVLDICNMSPQRFDQYRTALDRVLQEQMSRLAKFNLIRSVAIDSLSISGESYSNGLDTALYKNHFFYILSIAV